MKQAIVLTYPNLTKKESELLKNTNIFKIACNWHAEELKPDKRLIADRGILDKVKAVGNQPIVTFLEYYPDDERLEDYRHLPARHSTLLTCVDYLIENRYTDVLLIADNSQTNGKEIDKKFQEHNKKTITQLNNFINIYKYSENGVFDIPHLPIEEFLKMAKPAQRVNLTAEDKILGKTLEEKQNETKEQGSKYEKMFMFTDAFLFEVHTKGRDNKSVETGEFIKNLLPPKKQQELLDDIKEVEYNGIVIKRITGK